MSEYMPSGPVRPELLPIAIGLAKIEGDTTKIEERFIKAYNTVKNFSDANLDRKLMAAEIMTASGVDDFYSLEESLSTIERTLRHDNGVPDKIAIGIAAILLYGRQTDGAYPIARFTEFLKLTSSFEASAMLAISTEDAQKLTDKFNSFKGIFVNSWGNQRTEDTDLASAFLATTEIELDNDKIKERMTVLVSALKNDLEFPLVPAAILASITPYEPRESLDLVEKSVSILQTYNAGLSRSELVSLAVRMVHGSKSPIGEKIDSTSKTTQTPVQFTTRPMRPAFGVPGFYGQGAYAAPGFGGQGPGIPYWYYWLIISHNSHCSNYANIGAASPSHSHAVGGFYG